MIKYYSTNHNSELISFKEALMKGQAPDKGLYMPNYIPKISSTKIASMKNMNYWEIAFTVINEFLKNEIPENDLKRIAKEAYNYDIPLEKISEKIYIMRMDQGPTASFKDFAARIMARLIQFYLKKENKKMIILVATSGDTGGAMANAFLSLKNLKVVILFPLKEVNERQRKQMTTLGKNITTIAVNGKFDDCQAIVKQAFSDSELNYLNLSSANSINFGRLLPQIAYYFYVYSKLSEKGKKIIFSIPSGNFGNLIGGLIAKKMGLPIYKFIVAVNENDEFPEFLKTKKYQPIKLSRNCLSNAMNVGHPSNLVRLIDLYKGQMNERGKIYKMPNIDLIKKDMFSISVSDNETKTTMKDIYQKHKVILEPHGAVGFTALEKFLVKIKNPPLAISLETAHPAKFPEELKKILNIKIRSPKSLKKIENKKETFKNISSNYKEFKQFLQNNIKN